ncbi:NUDIX hydrolase [Candidatus Pacearchaeota archaeon]|nr:NUDIX hydrolase [Candidatus Pacearchaeota archaeon]
MKEIIQRDDGKYELEWFDKTSFDSLGDITQVYGFLFTEDGKLCVVNPGRDWRLPGGHPDDEDDGWRDTIIREAHEEADVEIDSEQIIPIGYIKVTPVDKNNSRGVHYLLRCVGRITRINEQTDDISEGLINDREFIVPSDFSNYCDWAEGGDVQMEKAWDTFKSILYK